MRGCVLDKSRDDHVTLENKMAEVSSYSVWCLFIFLAISSVSCAETEYNVGIGIADITGPAAQVNMVGDAHLKDNC